MLRTLVVPLDGSELAERAVPYAVRLAEASGGRLVLVRAGEPAGIGESQSYLDAVAEKVARRVAVETATPFGHVSDAILSVVRESKADEIVMATHGRTGLPHLLYGSVAEAVLAHSPVPVFVVHARPGQAARPPFDPPSARIVVPLDGSLFAEAAVPVALDMLGAAGELVLLKVDPSPENVVMDERGHVVAFVDQQEQTVRGEALDYLGGVAARLTHTTPELHVACEARLGDAAEGITTVQIERGADLVVMATHGRTGLGRAIIGSVAGAVLGHGTTPVLLVRPSGLQESAQTEPAGPTLIVA